MKLRTPHDALGRLLEVGDSVEMFDGEICEIFATNGDHIYYYGATGPAWTFSRCVVWFCEPPAKADPVPAVVARAGAVQGVRTRVLGTPQGAYLVRCSNYGMSDFQSIAAGYREAA